VLYWRLLSSVVFVCVTAATAKLVDVFLCVCLFMILFAEWQLDISLFEVRTFPKTFLRKTGGRNNGNCLPVTQITQGNLPLIWTWWSMMAEMYRPTNFSDNQLTTVYQQYGCIQGPGHNFGAGQIWGPSHELGRGLRGTATVRMTIEWRTVVDMWLWQFVCGAWAACTTATLQGEGDALAPKRRVHVGHKTTTRRKIPSQLIVVYTIV